MAALSKAPHPWKPVRSPSDRRPARPPWPRLYRALRAFPSIPHARPADSNQYRSRLPLLVRNYDFEATTTDLPTTSHVSRRIPRAPGRLPPRRIVRRPTSGRTTATSALPPDSTPSCATCRQPITLHRNGEEGRLRPQADSSRGREGPARTRRHSSRRQGSRRLGPKGFHASRSAGPAGRGPCRAASVGAAGICSDLLPGRP